MAMAVANSAADLKVELPGEHAGLDQKIMPLVRPARATA